MVETGMAGARMETTLNAETVAMPASMMTGVLSKASEMRNAK